jgi:TRAP-type mannitol/chloroaromatic compound transport system substrate-binding protein
MKPRLTTLLVAVLAVMALAAACAPQAAAPEDGSSSQAAPSAPQDEVIKWRMTTQGPAVSIWHYANEYFTDIVKDMSGGRLEITLHPGGSLFPVPDTLDNVVQGVVEMAQCGGVAFAGKDPTFTAVSFVTGASIDNTMDEAVYVWYTDYKDIVSDLYAKHGCKWLAPGWIPGEQYVSTVPIRTAEDYKGLKIRASGMSELLFQELGASTCYVQGSEIYSALQLGTIDGCDAAGAAGNWDTGLHEVTKYIIKPCFHLNMGHIDHFVNQDAWDSLPPDLQNIVQVAAIAGGDHFGNQIHAANLIAEQKMIDYGLEVITLPDEELAKIHEAAVKVWDDVAASTPEAARLLQIYEETCALVGKPMR